MKVVLINVSARPKGNTSIVTDLISVILKNHGIETEIVNIGNELIHGCIGCQYCFSDLNTDNHCVFRDDIVNELAEKIVQADGIVIGSPVYYGGITGNLKNALDRIFYSKMSHISGKVVLPFVVERRGGGQEALRSIQNFFDLSESYYVPTRYWSVLHGLEKGQVLQDEEGIYNIEYSANVMANMIKEQVNQTNQSYEKRFTSFI